MDFIFFPTDFLITTNSLPYGVNNTCCINCCSRVPKIWESVIYLLTDSLHGAVLLEKLSGFAASQEIPRIYGTPKFITVLTSARQLSLSWARSIQSPQSPPTSWRSVLILSSHLRLGLPNGLFPSGYPTKALCTPLPSPIHTTCPAHLILTMLLQLSIFYKIYDRFAGWRVYDRGIGVWFPAGLKDIFPPPPPQKKSTGWLRFHPILRSICAASSFSRSKTVRASTCASPPLYTLILWLFMEQTDNFYCPSVWNLKWPGKSSGLSPRRLGINPRPIHVGFVVEQVALIRGFLRVFGCALSESFLYCFIRILSPITDTIWTYQMTPSLGNTVQRNVSMDRDCV
jgi:hypothetical protein